MLPFSLVFSVLVKRAWPLLLIAVAAGIVTWQLNAADRRGYDRREAEYQAEQTQIEAAVQDAIATGVLDAAAREADAKEKLEIVAHNASVRISALTQHLNRVKKDEHDSAPGAISNTCPIQDHDQNPPTLGDVVLDRFTLRLLNEARANLSAAQADNSEPGADEEGGTAPTDPPVTGADLAINDLQVVQKYHELAARHDGLVDWVNAQCIDPSMQK